VKTLYTIKNNFLFNMQKTSGEKIAPQSKQMIKKCCLNINHIDLF